MSDLVHNQRIKLTANLLNTAASGMFITGVIAPIVAAVYGVPGPAQAPAWLVVTITLAWLAAGVFLHVPARRVLGRLR